MPELLPFGLNALQASFLALAVFIASFVRGYSGFGFSALVVASTGLVTNPLYAVPVVMLCEIAMSAGQARGVWPQIAWYKVSMLLAGAVVCMPFSIWALSSIGIDFARFFISIYVLIMCGLLFWGFRFTRPAGRTGYVGTGAISGLANAAAVGGLPVAILMTADDIAPAVFRASMVFYLCMIDIVALPLFWRAGVFTFDSIVAFLLTVPILIIGVALGSRHFFASSPQSFRRFAIALLAVLASLGLAKSVTGLI